MNQKQPSALTPGPDCAQFAPLLPLLNSQALEPDETRAIDDHMARCAWCQQQVREYEMMEAAMRERFSIAPAATPLVSMDAILARAGTPRTLAPQGSHAHLQPPISLFSQQGAASASSAPQPLSPRREQKSKESQGETPMFRRIKFVAAVATIAAIVALFAVVLHGFIPNHSGTNSAAQPAATTGYGPRLTNAQAQPVFAQSNPNVVYELLPATASSTQIALWRSDDGGKTWQHFATPGGKTTDSLHPSLFVSPLDAQVIFLTIDRGKLANGPGCPSSQASAGTVGAFVAHSGGHFDCALQYYSADGGAHWSLVQLPQDPNLGTGVLGNLSSTGTTITQSTLVTQGTRLYAIQGQSSDNGVVFGNTAARLVTSTDGGKTWQHADAALAAQGLSLSDFAATSGGSTIFAVTNGAGGIMGTDALWRSDDSGASWNQVGTLPGTAAMPGIDEASLTAVNGGAGAQPVLYVNIDDSYVVGDHVITVPPAPTNLHVSLDGGKTWQRVTQTGLPVNDTCLATLGTLSDGSALTACPSGDVFAWKSGDAGWHRVASLPAGDSGKIRAVQMIAGSNHQQTLLLVLGASGDYRVEQVKL